MTKYLQRQLTAISHRLKNLINFCKEDDVIKKERLIQNYNLALELIKKLNDENYVINNNELLYIYCEYNQFVLESKARERKQNKNNYNNSKIVKYPTEYKTKNTIKKARLVRVNYSHSPLIKRDN